MNRTIEDGHPEVAVDEGAVLEGARDEPRLLEAHIGKRAVLEPNALESLLIDAFGFEQRV